MSSRVSHLQNVVTVARLNNAIVTGLHSPDPPHPIRNSEREQTVRCLREQRRIGSDGNTRVTYAR